MTLVTKSQRSTKNQAPTSGLFRVLPNALTPDGKLRLERLQFMTRKEFREGTTMKQQLKALKQFYPATVSALGGPAGVQRWLAEDTPLPARVSRIFHKENREVIDRQDKFEELSQSEIIRKICGAV